MDEVLTKMLTSTPASKLHETIAELTARNERLREALGKVAKWVGEFPPTGHYWGNGEKMSYSAAFGSSGERDYMRQLAQKAIDETPEQSTANIQANGIETMLVNEGGLGYRQYISMREITEYAAKLREGQQ